MKSRTTPEFRELLQNLPECVQRQARLAYQLFRKNSSLPGLRFKRILREPPTFSARVGLNYRVVGALDGDVVIWYWIGTHAEYDKLIDSL